MTKSKLGPSGGPLKNTDAYDTSSRGDEVVKIHQVIVKSGDRIDQIQLIWRDAKGGTITSDPIGKGTGGTKNPAWPQNNVEPFVAIKGAIGYHDNSLRVFSIQFFTTNSSSPIYGCVKPECDRYFYYSCPEGYQIIDLFGWAGNEVDSVGVYIEPIPKT